MESTVDKKSPGTAASDRPGCLVFCSANNRHAHWLSDALHQWRVVQQDLASQDQLVDAILAAKPQLILLDFSGNCTENIGKCGMNMIALAQALRIKAPHRTLVAVGTMAYPEGAVAALRAGIGHFIDMMASADEARDTIDRLSATVSENEAPAPGAIIALLGARAGVGATTLAVHLADLLHKYKTAEGRECRICLLDLGTPSGDGQLYLNASGCFHFVDTLNNRHRLDRTLIQTAMTQSANGVTIIPLPQNLGIHSFSDTDAVALLTQLRPYFDVLIMDLGGHGDPAFAIKMANAADQLWLVTDQSAGALVSLSALLRKIGKRDGDIRDRYLIVNRHDKQYGMIAPQIAERFGLPLAATIPDRTLNLMHSANSGKLLHEVVRNDPYICAAEALLDLVFTRLPDKWRTDKRSSWIPGFLRKRQLHRPVDNVGDKNK